MPKYGNIYLYLSMPTPIYSRRLKSSPKSQNVCEKALPRNQVTIVALFVYSLSHACSDIDRLVFITTKKLDSLWRTQLSNLQSQWSSVFKLSWILFCGYQFSSRELKISFCSILHSNWKPLLKLSFLYAPSRLVMKLRYRRISTDFRWFWWTFSMSFTRKSGLPFMV